MNVEKVTNGKRRRRLMGLDGRIRHLETLAAVSESIDKKVARIVAAQLPSLVKAAVEAEVARLASSPAPAKVGAS